MGGDKRAFVVPPPAPVSAADTAGLAPVPRLVPAADTSAHGAVPLVPVTLPTRGRGRGRGGASIPPPPVPAALLPQTTEPTGPLPTQRSAAAAGIEESPNAMQLDLAFCCDCTGSMGSYIKAAQDNIRAIAQALHDRKGATCSIRYALVKYRDHPPQDRTYVTEVYPFTRSIDVVKANVDTMSASGGGDGPEAVAAALHEVSTLNWRESASKVCVFIADAPPHGLGERGDGFPDGSPDGIDPIEVTRRLAQQGVTVYAIGVEPVLSQQYKFARDFMMMVASMTNGKFLPLGSAAILADVIVATSVEGMELEQMWIDIEATIEKDAAAKGEALSKEELCARVEAAMETKAKEAVVMNVEVENPYLNEAYDMANCEALVGATSLRAARAQLDTARNAHVPQSAAGYAWGEQRACFGAAQMSSEQHSRAKGRGRSRHGFGPS